MNQRYLVTIPISNTYPDVDGNTFAGACDPIAHGSRNIITYPKHKCAEKAVLLFSLCGGLGYGGDDIFEVPGFSIGEDEHGDGSQLAIDLLLRLVLESIVKCTADFRASVVGFYAVDMSARLRNRLGTVRSRRLPKGVVVRSKGHDIL